VPYRSSAQMPCREDRCLLLHSAFITANSTPVVSISRNLAPFGILDWKVITLKGLFHNSAPLHLWASERSRIVAPTSQDFSWGSC
jgi:hypothetical protein